MIVRVRYYPLTEDQENAAENMTAAQLKELRASVEKTAEVTVDWGNEGETVQNLVDKFGERPVYQSAVADFKVGLQNNLRTWAENGCTQDELQAKASAWKPGMKVIAKKKSPFEVLKEALEKGGVISDEERARLLAMLSR